MENARANKWRRCNRRLNARPITLNYHKHDVRSSSTFALDERAAFTIFLPPRARARQRSGRRDDEIFSTKITHSTTPTHPPTFARTSSYRFHGFESAHTRGKLYTIANRPRDRHSRLEPFLEETSVSPSTPPSIGLLFFPIASYRAQPQRVNRSRPCNRGGSARVALRRRSL